jgi:hypothetical protein
MPEDSLERLQRIQKERMAEDPDFEIHPDNIAKFSWGEDDDTLPGDGIVILNPGTLTADEVANKH